MKQRQAPAEACRGLERVSMELDERGQSGWRRRRLGAGPDPAEVFCCLIY